MEIKAIETQYKGYRFRSRLEARWAVFFDALGVEWEYEKEGFELPNGDRYLPDFWLKKPACWIEIKPDFVGNREIEKAGYLAATTKQWVNIFSGNPWPGEFTIIAYRHNYPIPDNDEIYKYALLALKNGDKRAFTMITRSLLSTAYTLDLLKEGEKQWGWKLSDFDNNQKPFRSHERSLCFCEFHHSLSFGHVMHMPSLCPECHQRTGEFYDPEFYGRCFDYESESENLYICPDHDLLSNPTITAAFGAARSARFEHGEKG